MKSTCSLDSCSSGRVDLYLTSLSTSTLEVLGWHVWTCVLACLLSCLTLHSHMCVWIKFPVATVIKNPRFCSLKQCSYLISQFCRSVWCVWQCPPLRVSWGQNQVASRAVRVPFWELWGWSDIPAHCSCLDSIPAVLGWKPLCCGLLTPLLMYPCSPLQQQQPEFQSAVFFPALTSVLRAYA